MFQFYTQRHLARPMGLLLLVPITTPLAAAFLHLTRPPLPPMQPVRTHADRPSVKSQPAPEKASGGGKKVGRGVTYPECDEEPKFPGRRRGGGGLFGACCGAPR